MTSPNYLTQIRNRYLSDIIDFLEKQEEKQRAQDLIDSQTKENVTGYTDGQRDKLIDLIEKLLKKFKMMRYFMEDD